MDFINLIMNFVFEKNEKLMIEYDYLMKMENPTAKGLKEKVLKQQ